MQREDHLKREGVRSGEYGALALGGRGLLKEAFELILKKDPVSDNCTQVERLKALSLWKEKEIWVCVWGEYQKRQQFWRSRLDNVTLTETRASHTLVSRSGRSEWTSSLCSVSTASSNVIANSGPRFCSSCKKLAPLQEAEG